MWRDTRLPKKHEPHLNMPESFGRKSCPMTVHSIWLKTSCRSQKSQASQVSISQPSVKVNNITAWDGYMTTSMSWKSKIKMNFFLLRCCHFPYLTQGSGGGGPPSTSSSWRRSVSNYYSFIILVVRAAVVWMDGVEFSLHERFLGRVMDKYFLLFSCCRLFSLLYINVLADSKMFFSCRCSIINLRFGEKHSLIFNIVRLLIQHHLAKCIFDVEL